jgi:hypothetical protein
MLQFHRFTEATCPREDRHSARLAVQSCVLVSSAGRKLTPEAADALGMNVLLDGVPFPTTDPPSPTPADAVGAPAARARSEFGRLFEGMGRAIDGGEALVGKAEHAAYAPMDAGTLIALQSGIYRYSEAIDLTAKLVDRATSAVRTVLQAGH